MFFLSNTTIDATKYLLFLAWYLSLLLINRLTLILSEKKSIPEHNNALLALLVSNNFAEIKSNVFKKVSKENLHNLVYYGECAYDCVISMILNQMLMDDCICYASTVWMILLNLSLLHSCICQYVMCGLLLLSTYLVFSTSISLCGMNRAEYVVDSK